MKEIISAVLIVVSLFAGTHFLKEIHAAIRKAALERDLIAERVRNGLANAKAKGKHIGRVRKRNTVLIESLLEAGLSYREIARIAKCSHGSVHAQKIEWKKKKELEEQSRQLAFAADPIHSADGISFDPGPTRTDGGAPSGYVGTNQPQ